MPMDEIDRKTSNAVRKMIAVHGTRFDYSRYRHVNNTTPGEIVCPTHGIFRISLATHTKSFTGCQRCSREPLARAKALTLSEVIARATRVHGSTYKYDEDQVYANARTPLIIECREHGIFRQSFDSHVNQGSGCPACFGTTKRTTQQFVRLAVAKHGNSYDYSRASYVSNATRLEIVCPNHGSFWKTPVQHLNVGRGCERCHDGPSSAEKKWLSSLEIPNEKRHVRLSNGMIASGLVDGVVYDFYAQLWHGDPRRYQPHEINRRNGRRMSDLYLETIERQQKIRDLGLKLKFVWEVDFREGKSTSATNPL